MDQNQSQMISRRSTLLKRVLAALALVLLSVFFVCAGVLLFVRIGLEGDQAARIMIHRLEAATGARIAFASANLTWVSADTASVVFKDLTIKETPQSPSLLNVPVATLEVSLIPALRGVLQVNRLELTRPDFFVTASNATKTTGIPAGWNIRGFRIFPIIKRLDVTGGQLFSLQTGQAASAGKPVLSDLRISAVDVSLAGAESIRIQGASAHNGAAGGFDVFARFDATPFGAKEWQGEVTARVSDCPALPFRTAVALFDHDLPLSQGSLSAGFKIRFEGGNFKSNGEVTLSDGVLSPGLVFSDEVPVERAEVRFLAELVDETLTVDLKEASLPGVMVAGQAKIAGVFSSDPSLSLNLKKADLDLTRLFPLMPVRLLKAADREKLTNAGLRGHVVVAGGNWAGKMSELETDWTGRGALFLDAYLDRVSGFVPGFGIPISDATGAIRVSADEVIFKGISFAVGNSPIVLNGWITHLKSDPTADLFLSTTAQARDLWPLLENKALFSKFEQWLGWILAPEGGVSITLDVKGNLARPTMKGKIGLEDFQCQLAGFPLPLKKVNGSLRFRGGGVSFSSLKGAVGETQVEIGGEINDGEANVSAAAKLAPADLKKLNILPAEWSLAGLVSASMTLRGKLPDASFSAQLDLAENSLEIGRWVKKNPGTPLALEVSGTRSQTATTIEEAYLVLRDARVSGKGVMNEEGRTTLSVNLPPKGIPTSVLIPYANPSLDLQPGGRVEGDAIVRSGFDRTREVNLDANLVLNHVSLHIPGFYKRTEGFTGTFRKRGKTLALQLERAKIGSSVLSGTLSLTEGDVPRLDVVADFSFLDTTDFTAPLGYVSNVTWGEWIRSSPVIRFLARSRGAASLKVAKGKTAYRTFSDFRANFEGSGGIVRVPKWQMEFADGLLRGTALFDIKANSSRPFTVSFQGDQLRMERIMLSDPDRVKIEGKVVAEGQMDWRLTSKRENYGIYKSGNIEVRMQDGVIHRFEVLSKIFSLINLGSIVRGRLPDVIGQGLAFQRLTWNMEVFDSKWKIKDLKLVSDAARIDSSGMYFSGQERVDFKVDVSPLVGLDTIVSGIFGNLITKDGKTLTTTFRVRGLYASPDVRLEPFENVKSDE
jgi:hypothetical protein